MTQKQICRFLQLRAYNELKESSLTKDQKMDNYYAYVLRQIRSAATMGLNFVPIAIGDKEEAKLIFRRLKDDGFRSITQLGEDEPLSLFALVSIDY